VLQQAERAPTICCCMLSIRKQGKAYANFVDFTKKNIFKIKEVKQF
jgi:hypothetical protein